MSLQQSTNYMERIITIVYWKAAAKWEIFNLNNYKLSLQYNKAIAQTTVPPHTPAATFQLYSTSGTFRNRNLLSESGIFAGSIFLLACHKRPFWFQVKLSRSQISQSGLTNVWVQTALKLKIFTIYTEGLAAGTFIQNEMKKRRKKKHGQILSISHIVQSFTEECRNGFTAERVWEDGPLCAHSWSVSMSLALCWDSKHRRLRMQSPVQTNSCTCMRSHTQSFVI